MDMNMQPATNEGTNEQEKQKTSLHFSWFGHKVDMDTGEMVEKSGARRTPSFRVSKEQVTRHDTLVQAFVLKPPATRGERAYLRHPGRARG